MPLFTHKMDVCMTYTKQKIAEFFDLYYRFKYTNVILSLLLQWQWTICRILWSGDHHSFTI